jgi:hypothetical protein
VRAGRQQRRDLFGGGTEHHHQRCATAIGEHAGRPPDERLTSERDERLGPAHPAAGARGQQQPGGGYRLISVVGWT